MADDTVEPAAKRQRCDTAVEDHAAVLTQNTHDRIEEEDDEESCSSDSEEEGESPTPIDTSAVLASIREKAASANALYAENVANGTWLSVEAMKAKAREAAAENRLQDIV